MPEVHSRFQTILFYLVKMYNIVNNNFSLKYTEVICKIVSAPLQTFLEFRSRTLENLNVGSNIAHLRVIFQDDYNMPKGHKMITPEVGHTWACIFEVWRGLDICTSYG